jgi:hypothetical protein
LQALALLNNAFVIRQCEHIAARMEKQEKEAPANARVSGIFRLLLQRQPNADELTRFTAHAQTHGLANAVHVIINSNEFLHLD